MPPLETHIQAEAAQDPDIARARGEDGALWVTDRQALTPEELAAWLPQWEAALPERGELLAARRRHDVYRLDTEAFGPLVLKYTNPGKTKRRSAVAAWLTGRRLERALPGAVPGLIGAVDWLEGDQVVHACLITRFVAGEGLEPEGEPVALPPDLAQRLGRFQARLHRTGVYLQDCRLGNFHRVDSTVTNAGGVDGFCLPDLEALADGQPTRFQAARLALKLRLDRASLASFWSAYCAERGEDLSLVERLLLWGGYVPARQLRHRLLRFHRHRLRPLLYNGERHPPRGG
ncbi:MULTISPECIES: phosphotransferase [unclassified Halorhodospira]|uniref:phosphotransferase n=1 Tax=unclassified Halorhodospira TaxID=2626748 RepID=UPI001EE7BC95|nr:MULTISPECIES: phosphotransferase [unclassified Halorhodospira]MCG5541624.1 phosphotransferase [Halorhodospira sp. M39old]MCG5546560.1 phosphotransferase [Halorhodospira sp. M38]